MLPTNVLSRMGPYQDQGVSGQAHMGFPAFQQYQRNSHSSLKQEKGACSFCASEQLTVFPILEALFSFPPAISSFKGKHSFWKNGEYHRFFLSSHR